MAEKVLVYSTPTCPYCQQVKEYLKENNIDFNIDIDGEIIKGFDKEKLNQLLGID